MKPSGVIAKKNPIQTAFTVSPSFFPQNQYAEVSVDTGKPLIQEYKSLSRVISLKSTDENEETPESSSLVTESALSLMNDSLDNDRLSKSSSEENVTKNAMRRPTPLKIAKFDK